MMKPSIPPPANISSTQDKDMSLNALPSQSSLPLVVGIGASAGGLESFRIFFSFMPADSGAVFIVVQHLSPSHESLTTSLLSSCALMPVITIKDKIKIEPN